MTRIPRIPYFVLRTFAPKGINEFFLGDIEEQFHFIAESQGVHAAKRWFWLQTANSLFPLTLISLRQRLKLSLLRVVALFSAILPAVLTKPLYGDRDDYYSPGDMLLILFSTFMIGFLCRVIIRKVGFFQVTFVGILVFSVSLVIRGEFREIPPLLVLAMLFVSSGVGVASLFVGRNYTDPKIRG